MKGADGAHRLGDAVALLQELEEAQLGRDGGDDPQAGGEGERVHLLRLEGARHGHAQTAALQREREGQVVARELGLELRQGLLRHRPQLRFRREGEVVHVGQRLTQRVQVEQPQLDQVGAQAAAVDELGLQGLIHLCLGEESLPDEVRAELLSHGVPILDRTTSKGAPGKRRSPECPRLHA
jgi:hypothetical protein